MNFCKWEEWDVFHDFTSNEDKEGARRLSFRHRTGQNIQKLIHHYSDQQFPIPITAKAKVKCKLKQTLLSVHMKPKPDKQGGK